MITSTLKGESLLLKRTINRSEMNSVNASTNSSEKVNSSGLSFWLGPIITDYD